MFLEQVDNNWFGWCVLVDKIFVFIYITSICKNEWIKMYSSSDGTCYVRVPPAPICRL
jgi:hypothetical protein